VNERVLTVRPDDGPIGPKRVALYVSLMVIIDVFQGLILNGKDIKRSSDFCYFGSNVAENGGTSREVNATIQKAWGSFSKLRRVWLSKSLRNDTKIRIFNARVKSVLLYACETWLVTNEIQRKTQTLVNLCLRYILRIWWPNIISNKDL
jgi:hypothetical protein